jgi:hypothetical protein
MQYDKTSTRLRFMSNIVSVTLLLGAFLIFYIAYLLFWPQTPIKIFSVQILAPNITTTGLVAYKINYCKYVDAVSTVYRQLVADGPTAVSYGLPSIQGVAKKGCADQVVRVQLPPGTTPGRYFLHTDIAYPVNDLRIVHVYYNTGSFEVTK